MARRLSGAMSVRYSYRERAHEEIGSDGTQAQGAWSAREHGEAERKTRTVRVSGRGSRVCRHVTYAHGAARRRRSEIALIGVV